MPSEEIHSTNAQSPTPPENWLVDALKKQTVTIIVAIVWAAYTFIWNSHDTGKDLKYQVDANTKAIEQLRIDNKEQTDAQNQFLIALTKMSEAENRLAQDVKDIQTQQQRNTEMLLNLNRK